MPNTSNPASGRTGPRAAGPATPGGAGNVPPEPERDFRGAFGQGAADAAEAAATVLPMLGKWVSRSVYGACYYAAYGAVFTALAVSRALPPEGAVLKGFQDGAAAARRDAEGHLAERVTVGSEQSEPVAPTPGL